MSLFNNISIQGVPFNGLAAQPSQVFPQQYQYLLNQQVQVHPQIKGALPDIAAYIHNHIARLAQSNLPRAIHFNMLMTNGNPEMFILVTLVANMVYARLQRGEYHDLNTAVTQVVDWIVTRRINFITINVPDLFNQMQSEAASIQQFANEYAGEAQATLDFMSQTYMGGTSGFNNGNNQQQQQQRGGFGMGPATGFGNGNNNGGNMTMGFNGGGNGPAMGFGNGNNNNQRGGNVIVRSNDANAPAGNRFNDDLLGTPPAVEKPAKQQAQDNAPKASSVMEQMDRGLAPAMQKAAEVDQPYLDDKGDLIIKNLPTTNAKWMASRFQLHPLFFDKRRFAINRRGFKIEGINYVIDTLKNQQMDRAALSLPSTSEFLEQVKIENHTRAEYLEASLQNAAALVATVRTINVESDFLDRTTELRQNGHIVFRNPLTSVSEAASLSRQAAMMCGKHEFGVYNTEFFVAKDFIVMKEDAQRLRELSRCRTISTLTDEMRAIIQDPHASHTLRVAVVQLNAYLAECWMEWIRFYLCLDEFTGSDSFIDDVQPMRDDIAQIAGMPFRRLIDNNQQRFIQTYLAFGEEEDSSLSDSLTEDDGRVKDRDVVVVPILTPSMLVSTEFMDSEFGFLSSAEIDGRDVAACFSEQSTSRGFRQLVQALVENPRSVGLGAQIRRFYIATLDNVVYEVNLGLDDKTAPMLIKKVKQLF